MRHGSLYKRNGLYSAAVTVAALLATCQPGNAQTGEQSAPPPLQTAEGAICGGLVSGPTNGMLVWRETPCALPNPSFRSPAGDIVRLSDLRGRWVLVNLWATWCPPCVRELPALQKLQQAFSPTTLTVLTVNVDSRPLDVRQWLDEKGLKDLPAYTDSRNALPQMFAAGYFPYSLLLDNHGRERARLVGDANWASTEMIQVLREKMQEEK